MAGGKKGKDFSANPFKSLKGLNVSAQEKAKRPAELVPEPSPPAEPAETEEELFAREMGRLGISPRHAGDKPTDKEPAEKTPQQDTNQNDKALFLSAIGRMGSAFADELPVPVAPTASPRLRKLLKSGKLLPEAELDLHGLDRVRAREKVAYFLENCVYQGKKGVLLITGRGQGSTGEPVLRQEIESFLTREAGLWVLDWDRAPRRFGGDGALFVLLRGAK